MIGLDTNVVVRFLTDDDPVQSPLARALFDSLTEGEPGFIGRETLVELFWVLRRAYRLKVSQVCDVIDELVSSLEIVVEAADDAVAATSAARASGADFADNLIVAAARRSGCAEVVTFDGRAARLEGARLLTASA